MTKKLEKSDIPQFSPQCEPVCRPIKSSELGKHLKQGDCKALITIMQGRNLQDGEVLVKEGELDDTLFILTKGIVNVCNNLNGRNEVVYAMKVGECAGIRAFVEGSPRLATLVAKGPATVYTIKPTDFETLLETYPKQGYNFMRGMFRVLHLNLMRMNAETRQLMSYISKTGGRY